MATLHAVDPIRAEAVDQQLAAAKAASWAFEGEAFFAHGTALVQAGTDAWREERTTMAARPPLGEALDKASAAVERQERRELPFLFSSVHWTTEDRLANGGPGHPLSRHAFSQLLSRADAPGGAAGYLGQCTPEMRAPHVTHWLRQALDSKGSPTKGILRTALTGGQRAAYAVVSPRYVPCDLPAVVSTLREALPRGAKGAVVVAGPRWEIRAFYGSPIEPVVGEVFNCGVVVTGADDGSAPVCVRAIAERVRCVNLTRLTGTAVNVDIRHSSRQILAQVRQALEASSQAVSVFATDWADAMQQQLFADGSAYQPAEIFAALVRADLVRAPSGCSTSDFVDRLVTAWRVEPSYTRAGLVNAITRVAHTSSWTRSWVTADLEEQAGELVHVRVLLAPSGTTEQGNLLEVN